MPMTNPIAVPSTISRPSDLSTSASQQPTHTLGEHIDTDSPHREHPIVVVSRVSREKVSGAANE
jgi:hypothetical protein